MSEMKTNRVPAKPIADIVKTYLADQGERVTDGTFKAADVRSLAERADIREDTLAKILMGRSKTIDFDVADRLLCVMNLTDLWRTSLHDIYESVLLVEGLRKPERASGAKMCARLGCSNLFLQPKGTPPKKFCSKKCGTADWYHRNIGIKTQPRGPGRSLEKLVCRSGHERTPENTGWNGVAHFCRICRRETARQRAALRKQRANVSL